MILIVFSLCGCSENKVNIESACSIHSSCDNKEEIHHSNTIDEINYNDYTSLYQGEKEFIVLVGRNDCQWCAKIIDVISNINLVQDNLIYYLNIANLSDNELTEFFDSLEVMWKYDDELGIPLILKFKDKNIVDYLIGFPNYSNVETNLQSLWIENSLRIILEE